MEYATVEEMAKRWGVCAQAVQTCCEAGQIAGAERAGGAWRLPADTEPPQALRGAKSAQAGAGQTQAPAPHLMPLMNTPFLPGRCQESIEEMPDGPAKEIARAEYCYFSGQAEEAARRAELYLTCEDAEVRLSANLIYAYASLTNGQIRQARYALSEIQNTLGAGAGCLPPQLQAVAAFVGAAAAVLLHLPLPEGLPEPGAWLPLLPEGLRAFALYVQAHYGYLQEEYEKSLGIVEATLAMGAGKYPIPAIYLHLAAVMDCMSLKKTEQARRHLLAAWELARPDDLIEAFGEHHGLLGGMLEAVIKKDWPEDFKRMIAITYRFSGGWRKVHNPAVDHNVAGCLTTTEFAVAMLAARGWTNEEIGRHMKISPNTVKKHVSTVLQKLNIERRKDLKQHMLW